MTLSPRLSRLLVWTTLGMGLFVLGCDQVSEPEARQRPTVSQLVVVPDTFNAADLEPLSDQDSLVADTVAISIRANDPDGQIARVAFTVEPAFNPRSTITGPMRQSQAADDLYVGGAILTVPRYREATYTIRAYAVDDDSLVSNQGVGRLQVIPEL